LRQPNTKKFYESCRKKPLPARLTWEALGDPILPPATGTAACVPDDSSYCPVERFRGPEGQFKKLNNPLLFRWRDELLLYHGWVTNGEMVIWMAHQPFNGANLLRGWQCYEGNPVTPVREDVKQLDAAVVSADGKVFLYCSFVKKGGGGKRPRAFETIGAYVSDDARHFAPLGPRDGLFQGRAPEAVFYKGKIYLFCYIDPGSFDDNSDGLYAKYVLFISSDGEHFAYHGEILPLGAPGEWDSFFVTTARVIREDDWFYLLYCGSNLHEDWLQNAGIARSRDLLRWEKSFMNPIFGRCLDPNFGSMWYPTGIRIGADYYFTYEYTGRPMQEAETAYGVRSDGRKCPRHTPDWIRGVSILKGASLAEYFN